MPSTKERRPALPDTPLAVSEKAPAASPAPSSLYALRLPLHDQLVAPAASTSAPVHRPPLAPLPYQTTMPADRSTGHLAVSQPPPATHTKDEQFTPDTPRFTIGLQIATSRSLTVDEPPRSPGLQAPRRNKPVNQSPSSTRNPQYPRPSSSRRSSRASIGSISGRRTSLPALHARSPSTAATATAASSSHGHVPNDDIYSGLSTFTFGAATGGPSAYDADSEMIGPLQPALRKTSVDRTPRPSVSSASSRRRGAGDDDDADADEDVTHRRIVRGKMRAVDDGARRPSLPTNLYRSADADADADPHASSSPSDVDVDPHDSGGDLDTDVEFEPQPRRTPERILDSDTASINTFGGGSERFERRRSGAETPRHAGSSDEGGGDARSPLDMHDIAPWLMPEGPLSIAPVAGQALNGYPPYAPTSPVRQRDGSLSTVREAAGDPSGAFGTDIFHAHDLVRGAPHDGAGDDPGAGDPQEEVYDGFDLSYILAGAGTNSRRPSAALTGPAYDGRRQSGGAPLGGFAFAWPRPRAGGSMGDIAGLRRPSIATTVGSGDDTFNRHVRTMDEAYSALVAEWTFAREKADGAAAAALALTRVGSGGTQASAMIATATKGKSSVNVGHQELWRCLHVGRWKVDRMMYRADPSKPVQQRLSVRHILDPYSKGNKRGGPSILIHKHSRAIAFSIFREHSLHDPRRGVGGTTHMSMNNSILLAPKSVQEQYTSTRTTSKLSTHGLLEDRPDRPSTSSASYGTESGGSVAGGRSQSRVRKEKERKAKDSDKERKEKDKKAKMKGGVNGSSRPGSGTGTGTESDGFASKTARGYSMRRATLQGRASSPPDPDASPAVRMSPPPQDPLRSVSTSTTSTHGRSPSPDTISSQLTSVDSASTSPVLPSNVSMATSATYTNPAPGDLVRVREDSMDMDDADQPLQRTTHQEAFATLDSGFFEQQRFRSERQSDREKVGLAERMRRALLGGAVPRSTTRAGPYAGAAPSVAKLESNYEPPWLTMAPRSIQEEQERVIQTLNESFKDVGLLPSHTFRTQEKERERKSRHRSKKAVVEDVFDEVPEDSLYMLLPLWPRETDPAFMEDPAKYHVPVEDRQYLLVYYVPTAGKGSKDKKAREAAQTGSQTRSGERGGPKVTDIVLTSFHACAKVIGYLELRNTGVRLPNEGLSVTGPMREAIATIPPAAIRAIKYDAMVLGLWKGRDKGLELVMDPLYKLGLTYQPTQSPIDPDDGDVAPPPLTPLGRAAMEMTWLGAMALTSFDPV